jgi:hypothetical protein
VCRIVPSELVGTAGVYGAAKVFLEQVIQPESEKADRVSKKERAGSRKRK